MSPQVDNHVQQLYRISGFTGSLTSVSASAPKIWYLSLILSHQSLLSCAQWCSPAALKRCHHQCVWTLHGLPEFEDVDQSFNKSSLKFPRLQGNKVQVWWHCVNLFWGQNGENAKIFSSFFCFLAYVCPAIYFWYGFDCKMT